MTARYMMTQDPEAWALARIESIEREEPRAETIRPSTAKTGVFGKLFGGRPAANGNQRRTALENSSEIHERIATIIAYRLLHAGRPSIAQLLPESLFEGPLPEDDEERFVLLTEAAARTVRHHLDQQIPGVPEGEVPGLRMQSIVHALGDESTDRLSERLRRHLHAGLVERHRNIELAKSDALLIEIDNVDLGDVDEHGAMPYSLDVLVDGHRLATLSSSGDGTLDVKAWLGGHGPEDLDALRAYVARCGEPRYDEQGERPDSLEELLLDRVTALLTRHAFVKALSEAVLFCDFERGAPGGRVIRVAEIDPEIGREAVVEAVTEEFPDALLLDAMHEDDAFMLWLAYSMV